MIARLQFQKFAALHAWNEGQFVALMTHATHSAASAGSCKQRQHGVPAILSAAACSQRLRCNACKCHHHHHDTMQLQPASIFA